MGREGEWKLKEPGRRKIDARLYFFAGEWMKEKMNEEFQRYFRLLLVGFIILFIFGGAEVVPSSAESNKEKIIPISFCTIDKGSQSGIKEQRFVVVKTEKEWEDLWRLHKGTFLPEQRIPSVDLKQEMIIGVFSGEKRTGGYRIEITKIEENGEKRQLIVFFLESQPPSRAMVTEALTQPYHIVRTRRIELPVKFIPESKI